MFAKRRPHLTVDVIIPDREGKVLLLSRGHRPFKRFWCFPGGIVDYGETIEHAAIREVREEVGIEVSIDRVFGIFSRPHRDPRGHYITVVLIAKPTNDPAHTSEEALALMKANPASDQQMAFDHRQILDAYWASLRQPVPKVVLG